MWVLYRTLTWRYLVKRYDRALLIMLSIALGVATFVSTRILNDFIDNAASETTTPFKGLANLYITNGELGVQRDLAEQLRQVDGVEHAQPLIVERVVIPELKKNRTAVMLGVEVNDRVIEENRFGITITMMQPKGFPKKFRLPVFISRSLAEERAELGFAEDDVIVLRIAGRNREYLPVGILDLAGPAEALGRNVVAMEIAQAASAVNRNDRVSRIDVLYKPNANPETTKSLVEAVVGNQAQVRTLEMQGTSTQEVIGGIQIALSLCAAGAITVGLFLVYNALSVSVTERRHDIGVMRSIGATQFQIAALFAGEAIFLGWIGALVGVPMGVGLAELALFQLADELKSMFLSEELRITRWSLHLTLSAMGAGIVTAFLAALIPSIQAASDQPADAVRRAPGSGDRFFRRLHYAACATLLLSGLAVILARDYLPPRWGAYGGLILSLVGMLLSMPLFVEWMTRLLLPPTRWMLGIETRLAADNLLRASGRTGVVIGAFGAGVALMFQISGIGRSNEEPVLAWLDRAVTAELFLFSGTLASANSSSTPMEATVGSALQDKIPGVEATSGIRYCRVEYNNTVVVILALDAVNYQEMTTKRTGVSTPQIERFQKLQQPNTCIISENFAVKHGVNPGDTITIPGPTGAVKLLVLGTVQDYSWSKGTIVMDRASYAKLFRDPLVDFYHVYLRPTDPMEQAAVRAQVEEYAVENTLEVQDREKVNDYVGGLIRRVYTLAYLQQFIVGVVASLGIVTALLISVLQRRRELGLLRAVGATRFQVLFTVLAEALLMGVLGTFVGILVGLPLEWYMIRIVQLEESGFVFDVLIPWRATLGIAAGAMAVSAVAGLLPALRAVQLRITEAIAYE